MDDNMTQPTKQQIRTALAHCATITVEHEPMDESPEGYFDDPTNVEWIEKQLRVANDWAWCQVTVRAEWCGLVAEDHLGACSYESGEDFRESSGYFDDMRDAVLDELAARVSEIVDVTKMMLAAQGCVA